MNHHLLAVFSPLHVFPAPDQYYWTVYSRIMQNEELAYQEKKKQIIEELQLPSLFDYEDAYIRRIGGKLFVSPRYINVFTRSKVLSGHRRIDSLMQRLVTLIKQVKHSTNLDSIYHRNYRLHQVDYHPMEPFSLLLMLHEEDRESLQPGISGIPAADAQHYLLTLRRCRQRLIHVQDILQRRHPRSHDILEHISIYLELLEGFHEQALVRLSAEHIRHMGAHFDAQAAATPANAQAALDMLADNKIIDFTDYFNLNADR